MYITDLWSLFETGGKRTFMYVVDAKEYSSVKSVQLSQLYFDLSENGDKTFTDQKVYVQYDDSL